MQNGVFWFKTLSFYFFYFQLIDSISTQVPFKLSAILTVEKTHQNNKYYNPIT